MFYNLRFYNLIDVLSILPFFFTVAFGFEHRTNLYTKILQILRVVRLLKLAKNIPYNIVLKRTMKQSLPALYTYVIYVGVVVLLMSFIMHIAEGGTFEVSLEYPNGRYMRPSISGNSKEVSPFLSITDATYYVIITTTTIGYGDLHPTTAGGRFIACILSYAGILTWSVPLAIIGYNFINEDSKLSESKRQRSLTVQTVKRKYVAHYLDSEKDKLIILGEVIDLLTAALSNASYLSKYSKVMVDDLKLLRTSSLQLSNTSTLRRELKEDDENNRTDVSCDI
jgi:hypothetical protein